jgi:2-keto-4-pentenoate hydratase/2-oxohepta-3-ene-1,7-dioic acid hydratase in catechol pathway
MKLASYVHSGTNKIGAVLESVVIDLPGLHRYLASRSGSHFAATGSFPNSMKELIDLDQPWLRIAENMLSQAGSIPHEKLRSNQLIAPLVDCALRLPVPDPGQIIGIRLNYDENAPESERDVIEIPTLFMRSAMSLAACGEPMIRPAVSDMFDFEGELAVIIGRTARHVAHENAMDFVVGYAAFNDGTIRDWQHSTNQITAGKNFYKSGGFGPWITTADAAPPVTDINLRTRLNGEVVQAVNTSQMLMSAARLISYISAYTQLEPGDVIVTGTPSGVGGRRKPPRWLRDGDVISVELEGLGVLENPVKDEIEPVAGCFQTWRVPDIHKERRLAMLASNRHLSSPPK